MEISQGVKAMMTLSALRIRVFRKFAICEYYHARSHHLLSLSAWMTLRVWVEIIMGGAPEYFPGDENL